MEELKPCPFCGAEPMIHHDYSSESGDWWIIDCLNDDCPVCYTRAAWDGVNVTTGWRATEEEAVKAWNTRKSMETCRNLSEWHDADEFICSKCGIILNGYAEVVYNDDGSTDVFEFACEYCPNCGAKVVE